MGKGGKNNKPSSKPPTPAKPGRSSATASERVTPIPDFPKLPSPEGALRGYTASAAAGAGAPPASTNGGALGHFATRGTGAGANVTSSLPPPAANGGDGDVTASPPRFCATARPQHLNDGDSNSVPAASAAHMAECAAGLSGPAADLGGMGGMANREVSGFSALSGLSGVSSPTNGAPLAPRSVLDSIPQVADQWCAVCGPVGDDTATEDAAEAELALISAEFDTAEVITSEDGRLPSVIFDLEVDNGAALMFRRRYQQLAAEHARLQEADAAQRKALVAAASVASPVSQLPAPPPVAEAQSQAQPPSSSSKPKTKTQIRKEKLQAKKELQERGAAAPPLAPAAKDTAVGSALSEGELAKPPQTGLDLITRDLLKQEFSRLESRPARLRLKAQYTRGYPYKQPAISLFAPSLRQPICGSSSNAHCHGTAGSAGGAKTADGHCGLPAAGGARSRSRAQSMGPSPQVSPPADPAPPPTSTSAAGEDTPEARAERLQKEQEQEAQSVLDTLCGDFGSKLPKKLLESMIDPVKNALQVSLDGEPSILFIARAVKESFEHWVMTEMLALPHAESDDFLDDLDADDDSNIDVDDTCAVQENTRTSSQVHVSQSHPHGFPSSHSLGFESSGVAASQLCSGGNSSTIATASGSPLTLYGRGGNDGTLYGRGGTDGTAAAVGPARQTCSMFSQNESLEPTPDRRGSRPQTSVEGSADANRPVGIAGAVVGDASSDLSLESPSAAANRHNAGGAKVASPSMTAADCEVQGLVNTAPPTTTVASQPQHVSPQQQQQQRGGVVGARMEPNHQPSEMEAIGRMYSTDSGFQSGTRVANTGTLTPGAALGGMGARSHSQNLLRSGEGTPSRDGAHGGSPAIRSAQATPSHRPATLGSIGLAPATPPSLAGAVGAKSFGAGVGAGVGPHDTGASSVGSQMMHGSGVGSPLISSAPALMQPSPQIGPAASNSGIVGPGGIVTPMCRPSMGGIQPPAVKTLVGDAGLAVVGTDEKYVQLTEHHKKLEMFAVHCLARMCSSSATSTMFADDPVPQTFDSNMFDRQRLYLDEIGLIPSNIQYSQRTMSRAFGAAFRSCCPPTAPSAGAIGMYNADVNAMQSQADASTHWLWQLASDPTDPVQSTFPTASQNDRFTREFHCKSRIGAGGFASVFHVTRLIDKRQYAIKKVVLKTKQKDRVLREVQTLAAFDHPNIVRYFDAWVADGNHGDVLANDDDEEEEEEDEEDDLLDDNGDSDDMAFWASEKLDRMLNHAGDKGRNTQQRKASGRRVHYNDEDDDEDFSGESDDESGEEFTDDTESSDDARFMMTAPSAGSARPPTAATTTKRSFHVKDDDGHDGDSDALTSSSHQPEETASVESEESSGSFASNPFFAPQVDKTKAKRKGDSGHASGSSLCAESSMSSESKSSGSKSRNGDADVSDAVVRPGAAKRNTKRHGQKVRVGYDAPPTPTTSEGRGSAQELSPQGVRTPPTGTRGSRKFYGIYASTDDDDDNDGRRSEKKSSTSSLDLEEEAVADSLRLDDSPDVTGDHVGSKLKGTENVSKKLSLGAQPRRGKISSPDDDFPVVSPPTMAPGGQFPRMSTDDMGGELGLPEASMGTNVTADRLSAASSDSSTERVTVSDTSPTGFANPVSGRSGSDNGTDDERETTTGTCDGRAVGGNHPTGMKQESGNDDEPDSVRSGGDFFADSSSDSNGGAWWDRGGRKQTATASTCPSHKSSGATSSISRTSSLRRVQKTPSKIDSDDSMARARRNKTSAKKQRSDRSSATRSKSASSASNTSSLRRRRVKTHTPPPMSLQPSALDAAMGEDVRRSNRESPASVFSRQSGAVAAASGSRSTPTPEENAKVHQDDVDAGGNAASKRRGLEHLSSAPGSCSVSPGDRSQMGSPQSTKSRSPMATFSLQRSEEVSEIQTDDAAADRGGRAKKATMRRRHTDDHDVRGKAKGQHPQQAGGLSRSMSPGMTPSDRELSSMVFSNRSGRGQQNPANGRGGVKSSGVSTAVSTPSHHPLSAPPLSPSAGPEAAPVDGNALCTLFIQMELCKPTTLANMIEDGSLTEGFMQSVVRQLLHVIDHVHKQGAMHRDLKPANILFDLNDENVIKVADFGLARDSGGDARADTHSNKNDDHVDGDRSDGQHAGDASGDDSDDGAPMAHFSLEDDAIDAASSSDDEDERMGQSATTDKRNERASRRGGGSRSSKRSSKNRRESAVTVESAATDGATVGHSRCLTTNQGTPLYCAPEQESMEGNYGAKVDEFSAGIIFYEMWLSVDTEHEGNTFQPRHRMLGELRRTGKTPDWFKQRHPMMAGIIELLVEHDPFDRASAEDILSRPELPGDPPEVAAALDTIKDHPELAPRVWEQLRVHGADKASSTKLQRPPPALLPRPAVSLVRRLVDRLAELHGASPIDLPQTFPMILLQKLAIGSSEMQLDSNTRCSAAPSCGAVAMAAWLTGRIRDLTVLSKQPTHVFAAYRTTNPHATFNTNMSAGSAALSGVSSGATTDRSGGAGPVSAISLSGLLSGPNNVSGSISPSPAVAAQSSTEGIVTFVSRDHDAPLFSEAMELAANIALHAPAPPGALHTMEIGHTDLTRFCARTDLPRALTDAKPLTMRNFEETWPPLCHSLRKAIDAAKTPMNEAAWKHKRGEEHVAKAALKGLNELDKTIRTFFGGYRQKAGASPHVSPHSGPAGTPPTPPRSGSLPPRVEVDGNSRCPSSDTIGGGQPMTRTARKKAKLAAKKQKLTDHSDADGDTAGAASQQHTPNQKPAAAPHHHSLGSAGLACDTAFNPTVIVMPFMLGDPTQLRPPSSAPPQSPAGSTFGSSRQRGLLSPVPTTLLRTESKLMSRSMRGGGAPVTAAERLADSIASPLHSNTAAGVPPGLLCRVVTTGQSAPSRVCATVRRGDELMALLQPSTESPNSAGAPEFPTSSPHGHRYQSSGAWGTGPGSPTHHQGLHQHLQTVNVSIDMDALAVTGSPPASVSHQIGVVSADPMAKYYLGRSIRSSGATAKAIHITGSNRDNKAVDQVHKYGFAAMVEEKEGQVKLIQAGHSASAHSVCPSELCGAVATTLLSRDLRAHRLGLGFSAAVRSIVTTAQHIHARAVAGQTGALPPMGPHSTARPPISLSQLASPIPLMASVVGTPMSSATGPAAFHSSSPAVGGGYVDPQLVNALQHQGQGHTVAALCGGRSLTPLPEGTPGRSVSADPQTPSVAGAEEPSGLTQEETAVFTQQQALAQNQLDVLSQSSFIPASEAAAAAAAAVAVNETDPLQALHDHLKEHGEVKYIGRTNSQQYFSAKLALALQAREFPTTVIIAPDNAHSTCVRSAIHKYLLDVGSHSDNLAHAEGRQSHDECRKVGAMCHQSQRILSWLEHYAERYPAVALFAPGDESLEIMTNHGRMRKAGRKATDDAPAKYHPRTKKKGGKAHKRSQ